MAVLKVKINKITLYVCISFFKKYLTCILKDCLKCLSSTYCILCNQNSYIYYQDSSTVLCVSTCNTYTYGTGSGKIIKSFL